MSQSVIVLLEKGRKQRVAVTRHTPILLVLEEVCKKQELNSDDYDLKFHNRILDHASTIHFCGISNNAQLELVPVAKSRVQTPVSIFLQLEDGQRLAGSFLPACTLWFVINQLCDDEIKSKENPVIIYTRQEVLGDKLKTTTLKMLGLTSGSALLRLLHRTREQLKNQSVSSIYKLKPKSEPLEKEEKLKQKKNSTLRKEGTSQSSITSKDCCDDVEVNIKAVEVSGPMDVDMSSDILNECNLIEKDEQKDMLIESLAQGSTKGTDHSNTNQSRNVSSHSQDTKYQHKLISGLPQTTSKDVSGCESITEPPKQCSVRPSSLPKHSLKASTTQPVNTVVGGLTHSNIDLPSNTFVESLSQNSTLSKKSSDYVESDDENDPLFDINDIQFVGERYALIFRLDTVMSPKFEEASDEFYNLTVEDARSLLRDIQRTRSELEQSSLETSAIKARKKSLQRERMLRLYPHSIIRVVFPNRVVLQGIFKSSESVMDVVQFVKPFLTKSDLVYFLYVSPPKTILQENHSLVEIGAVPGIICYFGCESIDRSSMCEIIKESYIKKSVSPKIAFKVANHFRRVSRNPKLDDDPGGLKSLDDETNEGEQSNAQPAVETPTIPRRAPSGKVPKWFKMP